MKTLDFSKNTVIRHESELVHHFRQLLHDDAELAWRSSSEDSTHGQLSWVELKLDSQTRQFKPVYSLKPGIPELESILKTWTDPLPPLLIAPELVPRILDFCRQKRLAALDLNGRVYVRAKGLLVDRRSLPGRDFRFELEPRNIFTGKSARIVRTLLTDKEHIWTQAELVKRTKASSGLVSRIVQYLIAQAFLEKLNPRELRLSDPDGLIDAWTESDQLERRVSITRYSTFNTAQGIAQGLAEWAFNTRVDLAFTQWIAGWLRHPYTEPEITSAYVARLPDPLALMNALGLRPVEGAGKVWLYVPDEEGVFLETQQVKGLSLVSDAQIVVDLKKTGLRGPDQAKALRDWEGFCRS